MTDRLDDLLHRAVSQRVATTPVPRPYDELDLEEPFMPTPTWKQRSLVIAGVVAVVLAGIGLWAGLGSEDSQRVVTDPTSSTTATTVKDEEPATTTEPRPRSNADLPLEEQYILGPVTYPSGRVTLDSYGGMTFELTEERFVEEWFAGFSIIAGEPSVDGAAFWPTVHAFDPMEELDGTPIRTAEDVIRVVTDANEFTVEPLEQTFNLFGQPETQGYSVRGPQEPTPVFGMGDRGRFQLPPAGEFYPIETSEGLIVIFVSGWNQADLETAKTLFEQVAPTIQFG